MEERLKDVRQERGRLPATSPTATRADGTSVFFSVWGTTFGEGALANTERAGSEEDAGPLEGNDRMRTGCAGAALVRAAGTSGAGEGEERGELVGLREPHVAVLAEGVEVEPGEGSALLGRGLGVVEEVGEAEELGLRHLADDVTGEEQG
jgi:hypothetical protein